jgi:NAD(P)-dependent dehydrogenase (short-subunit alcohol dehydrogenase family)
MECIRAYRRAMALFSNKNERIRGVAGSMQDDRILVAGGASGTGPGIVQVLAAAGAEVVFTDPDHVAVDLLARKVETTIRPVTGMADGEWSTDGLPGLLRAAGEPLDAVVINPSRIESEREPRDRARISGPPLALADLAIRRMLDTGRRGRIVFVTSVAADVLGHDVLAPGWAALQQGMRQLARDYARNGIRVNAVAPGTVAVGRRGRTGTDRNAPLGHVTIHPHDVGKCVWFLLNDDLSSAITGTTLRVDRGMSLLAPEW